MQERVGGGRGGDAGETSPLGEPCPPMARGFYSCARADDREHILQRDMSCNGTWHVAFTVVPLQL